MNNENEDARSKFEQLVNGAYSQVENLMGQERYQAEVKSIESNSNANNAHAKKEMAKANLYDTFRGIISLLSVIGLVPLIVEIYRFIKG